MKFSFRLLFLILATVLFIVSVISDENQFDVLGLGLAAFAAAFFVDELNIGGGGRGRGR